MIRSCLFSRKELVDIIKKSPITNDGYHFCPRFKLIVLQTGSTKDNGYYYDRTLFKDFCCFNDDIISMFLAKKKKDLDIDLFNVIQTKLNEVIKGYEFLNIKDYIPKENYTLEELIDTTIYIFKYKYSNF